MNGGLGSVRVRQRFGWTPVLHLLLTLAPLASRTKGQGALVTTSLSKASGRKISAPAIFVENYHLCKLFVDQLCIVCLVYSI